MKIAIVGSGIAGNSAAYALSKHHDITMFEADDRLGGHANTSVIPDGFGNEVPVDTGFIVYNTPNYPNLVNLFAEAGVETELSDMSFAVSIGAGKLEYFGDTPGMFAQKRNFFRPSHWLMIRDLLRFYKEAKTQLEIAKLNNLTLGELLDLGKYSKAFRYRHILPMAAAIWSTPVERVRDFPAETFINFFENHKLFETDLDGRPKWRTVSGGSKRYVEKVSMGYRDSIVLGAPVVAARRTGDGMLLKIGGNHQEEMLFDQVVFACHPDQALAILGDHARPGERTVLGAIPYEKNLAVLHHDTKLMPKRPRAWASWNYIAEQEAHSDETMAPVALTYWMNRLQNIKTKTPTLLTLNPQTMPDEDKTYLQVQYDHPQFSKEAIIAQANLRAIQGVDRAWFCGAWCGYGFHEDGASAGFAVASALGAAPSWKNNIVEMSPAGMNATPACTPEEKAIAAE